MHRKLNTSIVSFLMKFCVIKATRKDMAILHLDVCGFRYFSELYTFDTAKMHRLFIINNCWPAAGPVKYMCVLCQDSVAFSITYSYFNKFVLKCSKISPKVTFIFYTIAIFFLYMKP